MFLTMSIALVYTNKAWTGFVLAFLIIATVASFLAAAYATSKYDALEDRIKKLENKKEDK